MTTTTDGEPPARIERGAERAVRRSAPTLEAVAALAGVSRSTVSRVVNGSSLVRPDVAQIVQAAVDRLNYVPNRAARSLVNNQTMAIALVVPEDAVRFFGDPFFAMIVQGITKALDASDYVLNLQLVSPTKPSPKTKKYLLGGNVDGAIVVSHHSGDEFFTELESALPVVFGGRPFDPDRHDNYYVDVDNLAGSGLATTHLLAQGRRCIATIAGPLDMQAAVDRTEGWANTLRAEGLPHELVAHGDFTLAGGAAAMRDLLARSTEIDGLFVASDLMAVGALSVLADRGIRVPDDIAVVGYDDSSAATVGGVALTTVHQPSTEMGDAMATVLLRRLRGEDVPRETLLPTYLVLRDSA